MLFSEGYYSTSQNTTLRQELCVEAMRLNLMLIQNHLTNIPSANALMSLMCFHSSRFDARINSNGEIVLYEDQDENLWNRELIQNGEYYLNQASTGKSLSKFHLEAAIAYWHTQKKETKEKWENILQLYNRLLQIEYSPMAALNRTYALSKANGKADAIKEAENDLQYQTTSEIESTNQKISSLRSQKKGLADIIDNNKSKIQELQQKIENLNQEIKDIS